MFSSSTSSIINNANPYGTPSILGHDNEEDIFVHRHHRDFTTNAHFLEAPAAINNTPPALEYANNILIKDWNHLINCDPLMINLVPRWKKPAKAHLSKDRHSKIVTAQGLRDRRVRLSIQIARKFFDLQDTLGFDKASKTLDWLLTKSKSAIEDLVKIKHSCCTTQDSGTNIGDNLNRKTLMSSCTSVAKEKRMSMQQQRNCTNFPLLSRSESRAKARERARERTKGKMSIRKLNESKKVVPDSGPPIPNHSSSWNQLSSHNSRMVLPYFNAGTEMSQNIAGSIMLKRKKSKPSQSFSTYEQNLINSKQVSLTSPNNTENWDISNSFSHGIPSTPPDFQNCGKMWEEYNYKITNQD